MSRRGPRKERLHRFAFWDDKLIYVGAFCWSMCSKIMDHFRVSKVSKCPCCPEEQARNKKKTRSNQVQRCRRCEFVPSVLVCGGYQGRIHFFSHIYGTYKHLSGKAGTAWYSKFGYCFNDWLGVASSFFLSLLGWDGLTLLDKHCRNETCWHPWHELLEGHRAKCMGGGAVCADSTLIGESEIWRGPLQQRKLQGIYREITRAARAFGHFLWLVWWFFLKLHWLQGYT